MPPKNTATLEIPAKKVRQLAAEGIEEVSPDKDTRIAALTLLATTTDAEIQSWFEPTPLPKCDLCGEPVEGNMFHFTIKPTPGTEMSVHVCAECHRKPKLGELVLGKHRRDARLCEVCGERLPPHPVATMLEGKRVCEGCADTYRTNTARERNVREDWKKNSPFNSMEVRT